MLIFYLIFVLLIIFAIFNDRFTLNTKKYFFNGFGLILILFAGLRGPSVDRDYNSYFKYFQIAPSIDYLFTNSKYFFSQIRTNIEPSITIIMSSLKAISDKWFPLMIMLYAIASISLKLTAIKRLSEFLPYSMLIYFPGLFLLQDMTQIRIGMASGFLLLSIPHIINRNIKKFLVLLLLAIFFHYSALVFAPFYFFNSKSINKIFYSSLIITSIVLGIIHFNPFDIILKFNLGFLTQIIHDQVNSQTLMKKLNIFNVITLSNVLLCIFFIFNANKIKNQYTIILTKIYSFSVIFFYFFSFTPVMAFRTSEVLNIVQIVLIPQLLYIIKPKLLAEGTIILISLFYFLNQILINPIMNPYVSIFMS